MQNIKNKKSENSILMTNILDSINSSIFLIDKNKKILKYNKEFLDNFKINFTLNDEKKYETIDISSKKSGVNYFKIRFDKKLENEESKCCVLNRAINTAINDNIPTNKQIISDEYMANGKIQKIFLSFSVKPLIIKEKTYILVIIDDISDFESTKLSLMKKNMKVKRYNTMYRKELKMAKGVQSAILPKKLFISDDFKIDFRYFPLGEIGGDFFDFFKIDEEHIAIILCDVAGHGIASALITTMIKAMLEGARHLYLSPKKLVKYINNQIIKIFENCFLTMIYGVINTNTGKFNYVRAGHPKPWLLANNSVSTMGLKNNIILGVDSKIKFEEDELWIKKSNKLILFTDGLIDIGYKNSGYEKEIMNLIKENSFCKTDILLDKIEENVKDRLKDEKHQDDICILVIEKL